MHACMHTSIHTFIHTYMHTYIYMADMFECRSSFFLKQDSYTTQAIRMMVKYLNSLRDPIARNLVIVI